MTQIFISAQFTVICVLTINKINSDEAEEIFFLSKKEKDQ